MEQEKIFEHVEEADKTTLMELLDAVVIGFENYMMTGS